MYEEHPCKINTLPDALLLKTSEPREGASNGIIYTVSRILQFLKACQPIDVTFFGMIMDVRLIQLRKVASSIKVILSGNMIVDRLLQLQKAKLPIEVTLFGIVIDVRLLQPKKAVCSIEVTLFGMVTFIRPLQFSKMWSLNDVTPFGIVMDIRLLQ